MSENKAEQLYKYYAASQMQMLEATRREYQLKEFYRNLSESDKRFLASLRIKWST